MLKDYRDICYDIEHGDFTASFPWLKIGPLRVLDQGGKIVLGDVKFYDKVHLRVGPDGYIEIGDHTTINHRTEIHSQSRVTIGRNCSISWGIMIMDTDYHGEGEHECVSEPVKIEDSVWICNNVTVLKGVTIKRGAIVAAGSIVVKDVPPFTIVGGNPAKPIKKIEPFEGKHGGLFEPHWWDPNFKPLPHEK